MDKSRYFNIIRTTAALLISFGTAFLIIALVSGTPLQSIYIFAIGPFTKTRYLGNIVERSIPLIFSGLGMAVLFQTKLVNLGGEGVFYLSGSLVSALAIFYIMPSFLHQTVIIAVGAFIGMAIMLIPGYLKAKFNGSELVVSLMLNNILLGVGLYLLNNQLRDPIAGSQVSYRFVPSSILPVILPGTKIHMGLIISLACAVLVYLFLYKTKWGYSLRMTGVNADYAKYSGINTYRAIILAHLVAGALMGMGGAVETIGMHKRFEWTGLPGYGFEGCMIAMLANNNPLGVIGAALFVGYLHIGADMVARLSDVPTEMIAVLQCVILLLVSAERFLHSIRQKWIEKEVLQ